MLCCRDMPWLSVLSQREERLVWVQITENT